VRAREIKLGTGGLRDVEFAVQLLQMVHGRSDDSLRVASTWTRCRVERRRYIGRQERPTSPPPTSSCGCSSTDCSCSGSSAPTAARGRRRRGRALAGARGAYASGRIARCGGVLREEIKHHNLRVSQLHAKLFYQPLLESIGPPAWKSAV